MINAVDANKLFLRRRFDLPSAVEALLDPCVALLMLMLCATLLQQPLSTRYMVLTVITFSLSFPGSVGLHEPMRRVARKVVTNWMGLMLLLAGFALLSGYLGTFNRRVLVAWVLLTPLAQLAAHALARQWLPALVRMRSAERQVVVVGVNDVGLQLAHQFANNPLLHSRVVGFFDDRSVDRLAELGDMPMLGSMDQIAGFLQQTQVDAIYLAVPMASQPRILNVLDQLKDTTASVYFVPDIFMTDLIQGQMINVGSMPVMAVCDTPFRGASGLVKRASDIAISALVLLLTSPLLLALALAVALTSRGPVIFRQRRYGLDGKEILVYKFRSMTATDDGAVVTQASRDDRRVTPLGAFLRKTSLDELPQFINVLQGRMSIVGPRPHAVAHNELYRKLIKGYMVRHKVRPGITGWAQVSGYRGETPTVELMTKRIEHDLEYLRNWSLGFDLWIMMKTARVVLGDRKAY